MRLHKGFSLLSLIVGIASSSLLLLTVGQLSSISRVNFSRNESTLQLYVDGRNAIQILRQYVPMAGVGIQQPTSTAAPNIQYTVLGAGVGTAPLPGGGAAVLKDWVYVGMRTIPNSPAPPSYTYTVSATSQPTWCTSQANLLKSTPSATPATITNNFMGLQGAKCYYGSNPGWGSVAASTYSYGLCCGNPSNATNCADPVYSCGASDSAAPAASSAGSVYQKLVPHLDVPTIGAAIGGDTLRVYFANRGPQSMKSYDNTTIPADASAGPPTNSPPLTLYNYTFQIVKNGTAYTLQMTDAGSGKVYNVVNNIEYMAVLVGESDRILSKDVAGDGTQTMQLPEMNRYVRFNAANLYPYRITAVRIALVVQSNDNVLATAAAPTLTLMTGSNNVPITYTPPQADRKLRKVFVTTIYLNSYALPEFRMNCVPGTSSGYQLQTSGISFTQTAATANDLCCVAGGAPAPCTSTTVFPTLNACEAKRMTGGC